MAETDGLAAGAVSLEEQAPEIVGPAVGVSPPESETPEPEEETTEPVTFDSRGQKLVPLEALQQTRSELKVLREQAKAAQQLQAEVEQLRGTAQTAAQTAAWVEQVRPLLAKLKDRPDIVTAVMSGQSVAPASQGPPAEPDILSPADAEDLARTLELYTPDGQPDLKRANKMARLQQKMAAQTSAAAVAPFQQMAAAGQSGTLRAQYAGMKDKAGRTVNAQVLDQMWNLVPPQLVASDPNVAGVLYYAAKGYAAHHGLDEPTPPPGVPVLTESPGGGSPAAQALTELDRKFAQTMGSEKAYKETSARYKPGAINLLE